MPYLLFIPLWVLSMGVYAWWHLRTPYQVIKTAKATNMTKANVRRSNEQLEEYSLQMTYVKDRYKVILTDSTELKAHIELLFLLSGVLSVIGIIYALTDLS